MKGLASQLRGAALIVGSAVVLSACGHSATVYMEDDLWVSGEITHSDASYVYVEQDDGRTVSVRADKVESIDHPGTAMQIVGGILAFAGLQMLSSSPSSNMDTAVFLGGIAGPGAIMAGWGIWANLRSRRAAQAPVVEKQRILDSRPYKPAPTYSPPVPAYPPPAYQPAPYSPPPAYQPAPGPVYPAAPTSVAPRLWVPYAPPPADPVDENPAPNPP
jgi:hypothetical protein